MIYKSPKAAWKSHIAPCSPKMPSRRTTKTAQLSALHGLWGSSLLSLKDADRWDALLACSSSINSSVSSKQIDCWSGRWHYHYFLRKSCCCCCWWWWCGALLLLLIMGSSSSSKKKEEEEWQLEGGFGQEHPKFRHIFFEFSKKCGSFGDYENIKFSLLFLLKSRNSRLNLVNFWQGCPISFVP